MSDEFLGTLIIVIPIVTLLSGVLIVVAGMIFKARTLELEHRERLAMIERGIAPPPESSPAGTVTSQRLPSARASRSRSIGVIVIGMGFAFMTMIGIAAEAPQVGIGIGGAIVILGTSFIIRAMVAGGSPESVPQPPSPRMPFPTPPPPPPADHQP